jgi:hypothetical protein
MKVSEFAEYLSKLPQDADVILEVGIENGYDGCNMEQQYLDYHHLELLVISNVLEIGQ